MGGRAGITPEFSDSVTIAVWQVPTGAGVWQNSALQLRELVSVPREALTPPYLFGCLPLRSFIF